jgi:hypothetical protein
MYISSCISHKLLAGFRHTGVDFGLLHLLELEIGLIGRHTTPMHLRDPMAGTSNTLCLSTYLMCISFRYYENNKFFLAISEMTRIKVLVLVV